MEPTAPVPIERLLEQRAWVQALSKALVVDRSRADDVAQDAWLAALRHPPRHAGALRAWFARLVRHRAANANRGDARRTARERATWDAPRSVDPADAVARIEAHERVVRAVLALSEPYRTTVVLRFFEGLSGPEIAERMGVPLDTVRTRSKRALAQLRERLDAEDRDGAAAWSAVLVPMSLGKGGVAMKTGTKAGLVAAALLVVAGVATWTMSRPSAPLAPLAEAGAVAAPAAKPLPVPARPPAVAGTTASIYGEVWQREPERPVPGVAVRLTSDGAADRSVVADGKGRFQFATLSPGTRGVVRVALDGRVAEPVAVQPLLTGESRFAGVMWLDPAVSVDVLVTSIDGRPLAGARVAAYQRPVISLERTVLGTSWYDDDSSSATWRDARDPAAKATTDAAGHASLGGLVAGNWRFVAESDGFTTVSRIETIAAGSSTKIALLLVPGADLAGSVEDAAGDPIAGLVVCAYPGERLDPNVAETAPRATSDADGRFVLKGVVDGRTMLWVSRFGRSPMPVRAVRVPTAGPLRVILGGADIHGTVRDAATGDAVPGARVRAMTGTAGHIAWVEAVTGADGAYVIELFASRAVVNQMRVEDFTVVEGELPDPRTVYASRFDIHDDAKVLVDLKVRRDVSVRGRVTHSGQPVRGARVRAFALPSGNLRIAATSTDGDGRYEVRGMAGFVVAVKVDAPALAQPGFPYGDLVSLLRASQVPPKCGVLVPPEGGATLDIELVDGTDITGRVVDPADQPVSGAELLLGDAVTSSGPDGAFAFRRVDPEAASGVGASKDGFVDCGVNLEALPLTIRMTPCRFVRGTVRATDGVLDSAWVQYAPRYGVDERTGSAPPADWGRARRAPVAADGTFSFGPGFAFCRIAVRAFSRGHGPSSPVDVVVDGKEPPPEVTIDVAPSVALRGRVLTEDGAPIAGARVELDRAKIDGWDECGRTVLRRTDAVADAEGRFEIAAVTPGAHKLLAVSDGFFGAIVEADPAMPDELQVRLARAMEIRGVVLRSDRRPIGAAGVTFFPRGATEPTAWSGPNYHATARSDGSFLCAAVPPGVYWARVSPYGSRLAFPPARFDDIAAGTTDAKFVVDTTRSISGRVVGSDGAAVTDADIWLRQDTDPPNRLSATAKTDASGHFEVLGLAGDHYSADVRPPSGSNAGIFWMNVRHLRAKFDGLVPGASGLELTLPLGAEIEGVLLDADGGPVVGRAIVPQRLVKPKPGEFVTDEKPGAITDGSGRFVVTGLAPGRYRVIAMSSYGLAGTAVSGGEDVEAGSRGLRLTLAGTASIAGRIVDENDAPFAGVTVVATGADGVRFFGATATDGSFEIKGVAGSGRYEVSARLNERLPMRALDVAPGATGVQIRLVRGSRASGRLVDAAGKPVTPATLVFRTEHGEVEAHAYVDEAGRFSVENLLPGSYRVEQMTSKGGEFVYLSCGTLRAGDEGIDLRRGD